MEALAIVFGFSLGFWNLSDLMVKKKFMRLFGPLLGLSVAFPLSLLNTSCTYVAAGSLLFGLGSLLIRLGAKN